MFASHRRQTSDDRELLPLHRPNSPPTSPRSPPALRTAVRASSPPPPPPPPTSSHYKRRDTPHDAALSELNSRSETTPNRKRYTLGAVNPRRPSVYDPFSGAYKGKLESASSSDSSDGSKEDSDDGVDIMKSMRSREDEMGAALAKIRVIQSDVARTHLAMEGLTRIPTQVIDDGKSDKSSKPNAKDAFAGRKAAIDNIVRKLDDLSVAVKEFHQIPSLPFDFPEPPPRSPTIEEDDMDFGSFTPYPTGYNPYTSPSPYGYNTPPPRSSTTSFGRSAARLPSPGASRPTSPRRNTVDTEPHSQRRLRFDSPTSTTSSFRMYN